MMTLEEMKAMVGTEFIYVYTDGDEIPGIVAAIDPEIGFTCLGTSEGTTTRDGYDFSDKIDENNNHCLIGLPADYIGGFMEYVSSRLEEIKKTGRYRAKASMTGSPSCSF